MNKRVDKLTRSCPYTRVDWLENIGWSQVFLPIYPAAGDVVEIESELCFTSLAERQAELTNADPRLHWGVYDEKSFYSGIGFHYSTSTGAADKEWHVFRIVSYGPDAGFWLDGEQTYAATPAEEAYAPTGFQLWRNLNSARRCLNRKRWLRISINGKVVMHLLPVLDDNGTPALYDTVTQQLFYNTGEDELVAGPVVGVAGYTQLEYIESCGGSIGAPAAYILLPVSADLSVDRFAFETEHELVPNGQNQGEGSNMVNPMFFYGVKQNGQTYYGIGHRNTFYVQDGTLWNAAGFVVRKWEFDGGIVKGWENGILDVEIETQQPDSENPVTWVGVFVAIGRPPFTENAGNAYPFNGRKKYFKVWVNDVLVRHLIPVLDAAGIPCMYDLVESQFYYSQGEADFVTGPALRS